MQVSTDNGVTFTDLYQLSEDTQGIIWLDSPAISLANFAGQTVRLRFKFDALDGLDNSGLGWAWTMCAWTPPRQKTARIATTRPPAAQAVTINGAPVTGTHLPGGRYGLLLLQRERRACRCASTWTPVDDR